MIKTGAGDSEHFVFRADAIDHGEFFAPRWLTNAIRGVISEPPPSPKERGRRIMKRDVRIETGQKDPRIYIGEALVHHVQ